MEKGIIKFAMCLLFLAVQPFYGQKYTTKTGSLKFEASVPSFEEVAAENKAASAVLEASTGDIAVLALMKGFRFKIALMEEHFNENYAETDTYPKGTFKGKIEGFSLAAVTASPKGFTLSGELTLHGKTKRITDTAEIAQSGGMIIVKGSFEVKPEEFDIKIPGVVSKKVAKTVTIYYNLSLSK